MKNAIITGATSFLGMAVTKSLLEENIRVLAVVRPHSLHLDRLPCSKHLQIVELDMAEISTLTNMKLPHYDSFYHFAWEGVRLPARDDMLVQEQNYTNAVNAIITADSLGCGMFIGAGSQAEYGLTGSIIDENCVANPNTPYGKSKLKVCDFGLEYSKNHSIRFIWPRIFSLYGIHDSESTLIMTCLKKMMKDETVNLSSCSKMWDYLHVSDAARAMILLGSSNNASGIYNIASGISMPLEKFVLDMKQIADSKSRIDFGSINEQIDGDYGFQPAVDRMKHELDWFAKISFVDGISDILNYLER